MKLLRSLLLCGCTGEASNKCAFKSWAGSQCQCPCHYTNEQRERLISAYLSIEQSFCYINKRLVKKVAEPSAKLVVAYGCGHDKEFDGKLSRMAMQYIQQNPCDACLQDRNKRA